VCFWLAKVSIFANDQENLSLPETKNMKKTPLITFFILTLLFSGCDRVFEYTPYSANVSERFEHTTENNLKNLKTIEQHMQCQNQFKIALISDNHIAYNELRDVINLINHDDSVCFVIHGGDITDNGMLKEFEIFHNMMDDLVHPYFTVIGNHDCLVNGRTIYKEMFGPENYSFVFKNCKFIFFNDIIWELNYEDPDYYWLIDQLQDSGEYNKVFVIAHIPPWSDQFSGASTIFYKTLMDTFNVTVSIHGHHHDCEYQEYYHDSVKYLVIGAPVNGYYCEMSVFEDSVHLEKVKI